MDRFIQTITRKAGRAVRARFGKDKVHYQKSDHRGDAVTKADLLSDNIIVSAIKKKYPRHGIISEESGKHNPDAEYVWIVDPIDGTLNFATGVSMFGVMIALAHKKRVMLSTIHLPMTDELFFAKRGKGAFLNGKRIHCSEHSDWSSSTGVGPSGLRQRAILFLENLLSEAKHKRLIYSGFASMAVDCAYVAAGRRDWYVGVNGQIHDYAPVVLLMEESGCVVTNTRGKPWSLQDTEAIAANPSLHPELLKLTRGV